MTFLLILLVFAGSREILAQAGDVPEGFTPIFNEKDLSGWHISRTNHHGTTGNFFVENKALVLKQQPFGRGGILLTDRKYGDFELYLEYKGDAGTNGGILLRSSESGSAYQVELAGDGAKGTGNMFGEMLTTTTTAEAEALDSVWNKGGWNSFRIRLVGAAPRATLWINGTKMWDLQFERNDLIGDVTRGMIALQLHWSQTQTVVPGGSCCDYSWKPGAAHRFRNIAIKE